MKGLLYKDWIMVKNHCRALFMMVVIFVGMSFVDSSALFLFYPCTFMGLLPMTLFSYDEAEKWCAYCDTLPITRGQYVSGKFIMGLLPSITVILFSGTVKAVQLIRSGIFLLPEFLSLVGLMAAVSLLAPAVLMPFIFKFGTQKGRVFFYIVIGAVAGGSVLLTNMTQSDYSNASGLVIFAFAAVVYGISWFLSIRLYRKREL